MFGKDGCTPLQTTAACTTLTPGDASKCMRVLLVPELFLIFVSPAQLALLHLGHWASTAPRTRFAVGHHGSWIMVQQNGAGLASREDLVALCNRLSVCL